MKNIFNYYEPVHKILVHILYLQAAKAGTRLHKCAVLSKLSLLQYTSKFDY